MNKVFLFGRLGGKPELRYVGNSNRNQTAVAKLNLATSKRWFDAKSNQPVEKTQWHRITAWGKTAELIANSCDKGDRLLIEGEIENKSYDKDGVKHYTSEIQLTSFEFIERRKDNNNQQQNNNNQSQNRSQNRNQRSNGNENGGFDDSNEMPPDYPSDAYSQDDSSSNGDGGGGGKDDIPF